MKCEKCNHLNSKYDIICEKCGSPLSIEKNIELQMKYNSKQKAIDIEEIKIDNTEVVFEDTKKKVSNILIVVFFFLFILLGIFGFNIYKDYNSTDALKQYDEFMKNNTVGIIYIGEDKKASKFLENNSLEYEYNYLYLNQNDITSYKKNKIREQLKLDKISNTVIVLDNKITVDFYHNFNISKEEDLTIFLKENNVLPDKLGKAQKISTNFDNYLKSKDTIIIYYSTINSKNIEKKEQIIKEFCNNYSINYKYIDGTYLTKKQQLRLFQKIDYTNIQDEVIIIIDDKKILDTIDESKNNNSEYFALLSSYGIIDSTSSNSIKSINYDQVKSLINSKDKNVILITSNECDNCNIIKPIIGKIGLQNELTIYQHNVTNDTLEKYIKNIGYNEAYIKTPLVIISEDGKIIDYITGLSDKSIYEETFREDGIIR